MATGSFFPRIESVFYAVFDVRQGPKIVYQVPEGLIGTSASASSASSTSSSVSPFLTSSSSPSPVTPDSPALPRLDSRTLLSPRKRPASAAEVLFNFDDISKYVIPQSALCGRLVICATGKHRIIGFPVELRGSYERNYFRYNLCFVFERTADLSCYEPIIRKVSRVLTNCEEESGFLSSPQSSPAIHAILEQLYEDLTSYSETSIPVDRFNSIDLKVFPFYPNPPPVKDWMVPLALIGLTKRIEPNWDLTMVRICQHIDGTNHVSRIARLADCDIDLARQAIAHLLYYQVIMMIDIFQYSNMYTLRTSIQWLADESNVRDECGPYATRPGEPIADWPKLLHLYSRLKPGKTVREWMEEYDVQSYGIDVRRFTSFGVIKGFLRRVHRWPILLRESQTQSPERLSLGRRRGQSFAAMASNQLPAARPGADPTRSRGRPQDPVPTISSTGAEIATTKVSISNAPLQPTRRASVAESSLERLRARDTRKAAHQIFTSPSRAGPPGSPTPATAGPRALRDIFDVSTVDPVGAQRLGLGAGTTSSTLSYLRPRPSRSPSAPAVSHVHAQVPMGPSFPQELLPLLDGEHHTDELCTRFEVGWPVMKAWLMLAGGGMGDEDYGQVSIIYR
ncbi:NPR2-domain-containing protein [Laetiporus sulphureus 93-53]|uniref:NPR2-domain-containing protein n=1 Tax=Laetiporus sulphureus 93-53 TaxID=1314785 RepID=A0A165FX85_9APHY|nr:NPR2-domain-containing protein [Laetiporus sulphureus 93-53]KZT09533.1 NPR2-domain-containing protein [Laetiporus sulphureus 93-53]